MRNQRGITLTSLIIYIVLIFVIIVILARVSVYFTSNMSEISKDSASISEMDKFNMYFLKDTKRTGNKIESVSEDGTSITFTNGTTYSFSKEDEIIYYENSADDKKIIIAETIEDCKFIQSKENSKDIVKVEITINEKVYKYEYVMRYQNAYKTYENESAYIGTEEIEGSEVFAITTNTDGVTFTKSDGVTLGDPYNLQNGDILIYEDYKYTYSGGGWSVVVTDKTKEEYGEIAVAAFGKPITSMYCTFDGCTNLIKTPQIPSTVTNISAAFRNCKLLTEMPDIPSGTTGMTYTFYNCTSIDGETTVPSGVKTLERAFYNCTSLTKAPKLSEGVTNLEYAFYNCSALTTVPEIPKTATKLSATFSGCKSIEYPPEIPSGVVNMSGTFQGCESLKEAPIIPNTVTEMSYTFTTCKLLIEAPQIPSSVTSMSYIYYGCTSLVKVPEVPSGVKKMEGAFRDCYKLQGEITINASPITYTNCFQNAGRDGTGIVLKGSSTVLNELAATDIKGKVTVEQ